MTFVLLCTSGSMRGAYVSKDGYSSSYTKTIKKMKKYETDEDAILDSCVENEYQFLYVVLLISEILYFVRSRLADVDPRPITHCFGGNYGHQKSL